MRKFMKQELVENIKILENANDAMNRNRKVFGPEERLDILGKCQESAINMGTRIEECEGEGTATVVLLEQYCELLYQISQVASDEIALEKLYTKVTAILKKTEDSIWKDLSDSKKEIVFLPYKASMWDSLESVWKAADADPDCEAYVIPIPYFDKNPDGSFKEEHYEGDEYPDYVPVTRYDEYDFARCRPDKIFIHNPYDEHNFVTSVHPFFYASNLKQYTDELVYIPYFVLEEIDPENEAAVEGMAHFVTVPSVVHSHKVIVQSEAMRQAYIKVMVKHTGEEYREYWEEKILGLGSPKLDKVVNTNREDITVPEGWQNILRKPDGSRKKVILYNITVTAMLKYEEKMLTKIQDVLRIFKENQEEVALLWRPHPLMKATLESMRPHLWEDYNGIVEQYKAEGWGIYDDTADLNRAIALCDGYYGDPSSLVQLCKSARKPILIQNVGLPEKH